MPSNVKDKRSRKKRRLSESRKEALKRARLKKDENYQMRRKQSENTDVLKKRKKELNKMRRVQVQ